MKKKLVECCARKSYQSSSGKQKTKDYILSKKSELFPG